MDNNDIVEQVKERNPIEDLVSEDGYTLPTRGRYRKVNRPGLGGLVVDTRNQCYHWNQKAEHGDVIAWVEREHKLDFKEAVTFFCRRAGLPEPNWGHQDPAVRAAARRKEDALSVAVRVFQSWLLRAAAATAYCQARGWSTVRVKARSDSRQHPEGGARVQRRRHEGSGKRCATSCWQAEWIWTARSRWRSPACRATWRDGRSGTACRRAS